MLAVIDTNLLVSALWSRNGAPARVLSMVISGQITPCYDYRILSEYREVLTRPKLKFSIGEVDALLDWITDCGRSVIANPLSINFTDESDKKFYEVAKTCGAILITGNIRHFPKDTCVLGVSEFMERNHF